MFQRVFAVWSLFLLPFLKSAWAYGFMVHVLLRPGSENFEHYKCVRWVQLCGSLSILWHCLSLGLEWKLTFSPCWVFQICWHVEYSTFTASSFKIWNRLAGIPSPPLALFEVILPKAHLTSHSLMSGSRWVITPLWSHWCISFVEMNFHKEMESGETSKVFIRRRKDHK